MNSFSQVRGDIAPSDCCIVPPMLKAAPIVVAHTPIGSGHRMAAEAVAAELCSLTSEQADVKVVDVLSLGSVQPSVDSLAETFTGPTAGVYDAIWSSPTGGTLARSLSTPALAWAYRKFTDYLVENRPGVVVCTHALAALLAARAVKSGRLNAQVVSVTTDFGVHGFWPRDDVALTCVAHEKVRDDLIVRGFAPESVAVTGIPVRPQFALDYDRMAARSLHRIPQGSRMLLVLAGATVSGPYTHLKEALATSLPALASMTDTSIVIVTGRDREYAKQLTSRARGFGVNNVHIMGYVEQMAPLMAASDVVMAKPGGLICAESLAMGLPLILVGPAAGQERANAVMLSEAGCALFVNDPNAVAEKSRSLFGRPARLKAMHQSAERAGRPFAAAEVAERALRLARID